MRGKRYSEEEIINVLKQADAGYSDNFCTGRMFSKENTSLFPLVHLEIVCLYVS